MHLPRLLVVLVVSCATGALAVEEGGKLYIKTKDTLLLKEPKAKAARVDTLQPGAEVVWLGVSEKNNQFHQVQVGAKKGFVSRADLTPHRPQLELDAASGRPMSPQAFAQSGAAPRSAPLWRGKGPEVQAAAAELLSVEELNRAKATPQAVAQKSKALHAP